MNAMNNLYKIVRFYARAGILPRTIRSGLSLQEAQAAVADPESSSDTCRMARNRRRTNAFGPWFIGYTRM